MSIITIPFNYDSKVDLETVPICISDIDADGNTIHFGWIERGVVPVADKLLNLSARLLHDEWRASEITESVVHKLSRDFGAELGTKPSLQVLCQARWHAQDLRAGSRRARRKADVPLYFDFREEVVPDEFDLASALAAQDTLDRLVDQLTEMEMYDVRDMIPMMLRIATHTNITIDSKSHGTPLRTSFTEACGKPPGPQVSQDRSLVQNKTTC